MLTRISNYVFQIFGVILFLTVLSFGFYFFDVGKMIFGAVDENASRQSRAIVESQYSAYDSQIVSGSNVLTAMRRYSNKTNFFIYVWKSGSGQFVAAPTGDGPSCRQIDFATATVSPTLINTCTVTESEMSSETSQYYVHPQDRYEAKIVRDASDNVAGIQFVQN